MGENGVMDENIVFTLVLRDECKKNGRLVVLGSVERVWKGELAREKNRDGGKRARDKAGKI